MAPELLAEVKQVEAIDALFGAEKYEVLLLKQQL